MSDVSRIYAEVTDHKLMALQLCDVIVIGVNGVCERVCVCVNYWKQFVLYIVIVNINFAINFQRVDLQ